MRGGVPDATGFDRAVPEGAGEAEAGHGRREAQVGRLRSAARPRHSGVAGAWRGCRPDADHRRAGRRAPAGRHHRLRERAPREAPGTRLTRRAATLAGGRQAARVTWGTCLVGSCLILEPTRHDGGPMARTLLSALAVIAVLACGGDAKKPASHSRTHPAATRPSATHKTSRTKSSARRTTAGRDTTQKNPLTNRP